ncbi:MAG: hypothetical protein PSY14_16785 [bacterium]|nr:hypothetical protein [bacterium]
MSDSSIPPKPPAANVLNAAAPPAKPQGTQRLLDEAAPVKQTSADISKDRMPLKLEGRVVSQNRETGETRIATARGEITITSDKPMPKDATVSVELTRGKDGGLMAQITLLREKVAATETPDLPPPLPAKLPPAPPLKPGDVVTALVMRDEAVNPPQAAQEADIPLQRAAQVLERLTPDMLRQLPKPLPVPNEVIQQLAAAPDKLAALQKLPPEQQQAILNYLAKPEVATKLAQMIQMPLPASPAPQTVPPQPTLPETDLPPLPVPVGKGTGNAPPPTGVGALKGLLPLIESLQNANPAAGGIMPRMASGQKTDMPQGLQGLIPSMSQLRIISITPQGETPPVPQQGQIPGEVEFVTTNGQPSIRAGGQSFLLRMPASLPIGTQVLFEATPMTPQQVMTNFQLDALRQTATPTGFTPLWSTTWPALQETMDALGALGGMPNAQAIRDSIPSPTPRLVPTALFFLAALRSGAIESWLGEGTLQSLRLAGKSALAERLAGDFGKISAQSKEPLSGEWRAISMPMMHDGEIGQMQFYIRRQQQDDAPEKDDDMRAAAPTRFILNLHLSRMGDMQLDGLLRKKTFDLILRSADALPESMRRELMGSFVKGLKQAEMEGGISFQTRAQKWVTIDTPMQGTNA